MSAAETLSHKERLLRRGMTLFYKQGFHGTTVDGILAAAEVPKGSFYHHFGSKDAFGQAVLDRYMAFQIDLLDKWAAKKGLTTTQKLVGYFKEMSGIFVKSGYQRACLAGKFSSEIAATSELFREQLGGQMHAWQQRVIGLLRQGQERGDVRTDQSAEQLADAVLSLIQGAFVITLSTRDKHTLTSATNAVALLVEAPKRPAGQ